MTLSAHKINIYY